MNDHVLDDLRVLDVTDGVAGGYASKLFVDAGASVTIAPPPDEDRSQPLHRFLDRGKQRAPSGPPSLERVDLVIEGGSLDVSRLRQEHPALVVLSITPYGRSGPFEHRPWTDLTVQAESGSILLRGRTTRPPVKAGGRLPELGAGLYGGAAALAAVRHARRTGSGAHVDVSMHEVMTIATNAFVDLMWGIMGRPPLAHPARGVLLPSVEPTSDGHVGFITNAQQQFFDFLVLVERPDLIDDPDMASHAGRVRRRRELKEIVHAWTRRHTTAEALEQAALLRIPAAPIGNGQTLLEIDHLKERGVFLDDADAGFTAPRRPYRFLQVGGPGSIPAPPAADPTGGPLPFSGLKVLDLGCWWAGPAATQLLAALGAEVIHLESTVRLDGMRTAGAAAFSTKPRWWEYSSFFQSINVNKLGLTLDLTRPEGSALAGRLVEWADVVLENYSPRVIEQFGLGWERVHELNPRAIMVRMPAFGLDGPWRDRVGFAQTMEQVSGMAWLTGYPDEEPMLPNGPCDPFGGMHAAFGLQVALAHRDRTGEGVLVEAPLIESALNIAAEQVVVYSATGELLQRDGNRSPGIAPQGIYECRQAEQWLAISVASDEQWSALRKVLRWNDLGFETAAERRAAHDELDARLAEWARGQDAEVAAAQLVAAGVPAARVRDPREIHTHEQHIARGFLEVVDHPVTGAHPVFGFPLRYSGVDRWNRTPAPTLGQHNREVLGGLLGLGDEEIADLEAQGIIGEAPAGL